MYLLRKENFTRGQYVFSRDKKTFNWELFVRGKKNYLSDKMLTKEHFSG